MQVPTFEKALPKIIRIGQQLLPPDAGTVFAVDSANAEHLRRLWLYFTQQEQELNKLGMTCKRGLLLMGQNGTGKTILMELFSRITGLYNVVPTRQILREYRQVGDGKDGNVGVIDKYTYLSQAQVFVDGVDIGVRPAAVCFDDWGHEKNEAKMFGNVVNLMEEIIADRYVLWRNSGMLTHATTNLDGDGIEAVYGRRVRDRAREMFNVMKIEGDSRRKTFGAL